MRNMLCYCLFTFIQSADSQKYSKQARRLTEKYLKLISFLKNFKNIFENVLNENAFPINFSIF